MADNPPHYLIVTKCICDTSKINISEYPELKALLPEEYLYRVCEVTKLDATRFVSRFRVNITTKDEALAWFVKFQLLTYTVFNKDRTFRENSPNIVFKVDMKCHHNTKPVRVVKRPDPRHTRCPARVAITVRQVELSRNYQSTDVHLNEFPTTIILHHRHNHMIDYDLEKRFLDRLKPPEFIPLLKQPKGRGMVQNLQAYIAEYNAKRQGRFAELIIHEEENFSVTLVSPLMKRVLESVPETAKVLFADSTVTIEPYNSKLFLLLTDSSFGGLPVGCILTTSDNEDILNRALESFKSFLNSKCFDGQGELGPKVIMIDDKGSGKKSFRKAFPSAVVSVCTYRVLQTLWRFTMDDSTGIHRERRLDFFCLLQQMVCCSSKEQLDRLYDNIMTCPSTASYPKYISYVYNMYGSRKEWAKCFRGKRSQIDLSTSKVCETAMRMVHENISKWKKALSVTELFHCIASDIECFYENHLITMANGRPTAYLKRNFKAEDFSSEKVGSNSYIVRSTKTNRLFCVDSEIGICSCMNGKFGGMCKHQILVSAKDDKSESQPDPVLRADLLFIASGHNDSSSTPHFMALLGEDQPQEIDKDFDPAEFYHCTLSRVSSLDCDNEEQVEDMVISHDNEIAPAPSPRLLRDTLPAIAKEQDSTSQDISPIRSDSQPKQEQNFTVIENMEISAESGSATSGLSTVNLADAENKRTEIRIQLKAIFDDMFLKMERSDHTLQAVEDFVKIYSSFDSEESLNSALRNFGKFNDSVR